MKEIAQTFMIVGGGLGLVASVPAALYVWFYGRAFGSELTRNEHLTIYSPLFCCATVALGVTWRKLQTKKTPREPFKLTEDGGDSGAA